MSKREYSRPDRDDEAPKPERMAEVDRRRVNSAASTEAVEFDAFRRELLEGKLPVSGQQRSTWLARVSELADRLCPNDEVKLRKPGIATRLFSAEIAVPYATPVDLEHMVLQLTSLWTEICPDDIEWRSYSYPDRKDAYWEVAISTEEGYVTAAVKLRTASFYIESKSTPAPEGEARRRYDSSDEERSHRPERPGRFDRPHDDRPRRTFEGEERRRSYHDRSSQDPSRHADRPHYDRPHFERPQHDRPYNDRPQGDRPYRDRPYGDRPQGDRPQGDRPHYDRPRYDRPQGDRPQGDRPQYDRPKYDRPRYDRPQGDRPQGDRPYGDRPQGDRPHGDRPQYDRPWKDRNEGDRPYGDRGRPERPYGDRGGSWGGGGGQDSGGQRPQGGGPGGYGNRGGKPGFGGRPSGGQGRPFKKSGPPDWVKKKKGY